MRRELCYHVGVVQAIFLLAGFQHALAMGIYDSYYKGNSGHKNSGYHQPSYEKSGYGKQKGYDSYDSGKDYEDSGYDSYKPKKSYYDPCFHKKDGDYVLSGEWKDFFSYADPECAFIKCSNYRSFLNECSHGTKNDAQGKGYCYFQDYKGRCGKPYPPIRKERVKKKIFKQKPKPKYPKYEPQYY